MNPFNYFGANISPSDLVLGYLSYLKSVNILKKIRTVTKYRKLYRNYISVLVRIWRGKYPIEAIMTNGKSVVLRNSLEVQIFDGRHKGIECDITNDVAHVHIGHNRRISFRGGVNNGDIKGIFVDKIYRWLPVKDKTVIDIGANIGDSAIYFALCGATKIISIEPFHKNFELAKRNILLNNFSNITLIQAGCSNYRGKIAIDPDLQSTGNRILKEFKEGLNVSLWPLKDILDKYDIKSDGSTVLKMDCEGCEYDTILSASEDTLEKFSHMIIEYHHGYRNLKKKLEECGFGVSVTRPRIYSWSSDKIHKKNYYAEGLILAKKD